MALARFGRQAKRPYGVCVKMTAVAVLGMCFIFVWSMFSASPSAVTSQRSSFGDINEPVPGSTGVGSSRTGLKKNKPEKTELSGGSNKVKFESDLAEKDEKKLDGSVTLAANGNNSTNIDKKEEANEGKEGIDKENHGSEGSENKESEKEKEEGEVGGDDKEEAVDREGEANEDVDADGDWAVTVEEEPVGKVEEESGRSKSTGKKKKRNGPLFDLKAQYTWKLCSTRSKHNYIPCIDNESGTGRLQSYRHRERSCPRTPPMCLIPLPAKGYSSPVPWPESKLKVLYKNVAHPKLAAFIKTHSWVVESGEYLMFPQNQSEFKGGVFHYLESLEEMVPDIEWGKNIRVVLDIGCTDVSFGAFLLDKEVLTLSLGLKDDLVDLAQVALERGFPAVVSHFGTRRLPFPSGVFDAIHCGGCNIAWHSNGGKLLLEMNRILRPGGYFILSSKHDNIEDEEEMTSLTASICWNVLAHKTDEISEVGVKIYQKPESNDIYELRRKKNPPICKEDEKPDAAWYVPMKTCLHTIPANLLSLAKRQTTMESVKKPHAVCLPLPAQGHMNPMLKIAKLLHSQGFYVTFVLTEFNYQLLVKSRGANSLKVFDDFRFETISDGLPPTNQRGILDLPALCLSMPVYSLLSFRELILKLKASSDVPPITCIVSDGVMSFTLEVAQEFGIPEMLFFTPSACGMLGYLHFEELIQRGYFPLKDESCLSNGYLDTSIDWIPGLNGVRLKDLPTFIRTTDPNDTMFNYNLLSVNNALKANSIILNTFEDLEKEVLDSIRTKFPPVYTIGPLWMLQQQLSEAKLDSIELNLWKEDTRCQDWLDKRERGSVVYVNYGSLVTLTPSQLSEFAWGLANSKCPFLWVIRSNLVVSEAEIISKDFMEEISGRGLLSGWCPQEKVLQHPAIGCFLTHCGWNSILESICEGVPMICWPFFAEQQTNCFFSCGKWGLGVEIDSNVRREKVEGLVRELMGGEKGKEMKETAMQWKKRAEKATRSGGSSYVNFHNLVKQLKGKPIIETNTISPENVT